MRRRALLAASTGLLALPVAGCTARSEAVVDRTVRDWQDEEDRSFAVRADAGDTISIELQETQSHGASFDIYRPDQWDGIRVFDSGRMPGGHASAQYVVEESGRHTVVVTPCCAPGGGTSYAWVRVYVE